MNGDYCRGPGPDGGPCELEVFRLGLCMAHAQQQVRKGKLHPLQEKLSPEERLIVAATEHLEADGDEDWERTRRATINAAKALGTKARSMTIREALAEAQARGVRIGRPPEVDLTEVRRWLAGIAADAQLATLSMGRKVRVVALVMGLSERTVRRALRRADKKKPFVQIPESSGLHPGRGSP